MSDNENQIFDAKVETIDLRGSSASLEEADIVKPFAKISSADPETLSCSEILSKEVNEIGSSPPTFQTNANSILENLPATKLEDEAGGRVFVDRTDNSASLTHASIRRRLVPREPQTLSPAKLAQVQSVEPKVSRDDIKASLHPKCPEVILETISLPKASEAKGIIKVLALWETVNHKEEASNFGSWESLIEESERLYDSKVETEEFNSQNNLRQAYTGFLASYPLCYGYWKKFADFVYATEGPSARSRYAKSFPDLWVYFLAFRMDQLHDKWVVRKAFKRGAEAIGIDFYSHPFWDKYLEFEQGLKNEDNVFGILSHVISIPMHQYAKYYEKYVAAIKGRTPQEILGEEVYSKYEADIRNSTSLQAMEGAAADTEVAEKLAARVQKHHTTLFETTQKETNLRWAFEGEIRRTYFHVKPLEHSQLQNWKRYLEFEEAQDDEMRIEVLYERCLVPCAQYQDFWVRYAHWLIPKAKFSKAEHAYRRATSVFVSPKYTTIRLDYALLLEMLGKHDEARAVYQKQLDSVPGHVETIYKSLHFERRIDPLKFKHALASHLESSTLSSESKAFLSSQLANYVFKEEGNVDAAACLFNDYLALYPDSEYLWTEYLRFCVTSGNSSAQVIENFAARLLRSKTSPSFKGDSLATCIAHLTECGSDAAVLTKLQSEVFRYAGRRFEPSLKRGFDPDSSSAGDPPKYKAMAAAPAPLAAKQDSKPAARPVSKPAARESSQTRPPPPKAHRYPAHKPTGRSDHRQPPHFRQPNSPRSSKSRFTPQAYFPRPPNYPQSYPPPPARHGVPHDGAPQPGFPNHWALAGPPMAPAQAPGGWTSMPNPHDQWVRPQYPYHPQPVTKLPPRRPIKPTPILLICKGEAFTRKPNKVPSIARALAITRRVVNSSVEALGKLWACRRVPTGGCRRNLSLPAIASTRRWV
ncbi:hypothetical protein L0F63_000573 [Massospora cicadina]|nr:hypothetical protein L0F63_000573 [Massospora cicadina]